VRADKLACFRSQLFSVDRKWTGLLRRQNNNRKYHKEKGKTEKTRRSFYLIIIRVVPYLRHSRLHFNFYGAPFLFVVKYQQISTYKKAGPTF
jgi:hypothetical protein